MTEDISEVQSDAVTVYLVIEYTGSEREVYFAAHNNTQRQFWIGRFSDNEHYSNLECLLLQLNPKDMESSFKVRCMAPEIKSQRKKIFEKLGEYDATEENIKPCTGDIQTALMFLLDKDLKFYTKETEDKKCLMAMNRLLQTLQLQKQMENKGKFSLKLLNLKASMILDKTVVNALQIFSKEMTKKLLANNSTIYQILNRCKTNFGTRCLQRWMRQPSQDVEEIERRLSKVDFFVSNAQVKNIIQNQLKTLPDLDKLYFVFYRVHAGKKSKCDVNDLIKIYRVITSMRELVKSLETKQDQHEIVGSIYQKLSANVGKIGMVATMVEKTIDLSGKRQNEYLVRPETQASLDAIMIHLRDTERNIEKEVAKVSKELNLEVEKNPSTTYKFVLEASKKDAIAFVKETPGYKFISAKQTKITFITDNLSRLCQELRLIEEQYKIEQEVVVKKMFHVVAGYYPVMEELSELLGELDVLTTFASVANTSTGKWARPTFGRDLSGVGMHHPCVKNCIANSCALNDQERTVVLTGPNMGGKSTFIRTIGICVYLAHIGCYVPAISFETPIIDAIITRVGASDMQVKGISTFMSEMLESSCMLKTATDRSLLLIDELGRGTSTCEGFGIAWSICEHLHRKIHSFTLFATHFHEMTRMADTIPGVRKMFTACRFEEGRLQLEYKIMDGKIEKSYGIEVMRMLEFPQAAIDEAQRVLACYQFDKTGEDDGSYSEQIQQEAVRLYKEMQQKLVLSNEPAEVERHYRRAIGMILH